MVQLVEHLTLDPSSGLDPRVMNSSPMLHGAYLSIYILYKIYTLYNMLYKILSVYNTKYEFILSMYIKSMNSY